MKIAHVLGNGPSRKDFVNEPFGDIYGCNLSDFSLPLKATFIMDAVTVNHIHQNKIKLPWPIVVCVSHLSTVKRCNPRVEVLDTIPKNITNGESTGHYAVGWCLSRYDEVHMWGFDAMYKDSVESDTHKKIPEGPFNKKNFLPWRKNWDKLMKEPNAQKCRIVPHPPIPAPTT